MSSFAVFLINLQSFVDHFKHLNYNDVTNNEDYVNIDALISSANNDFINAPFTDEEVLKARRSLKNKAKARANGGM